MRLRTVALAGVLVALAGCGGSSSGPSDGPVLLRGVAIDASSCAAAGRPVVDRAASAVEPTDVVALRLCPLAAPVHRPGVTLAPGDPGFEKLLSALVVPDEKPATGPCPEYADLPQPVLARTAHRTLIVAVPVDGCGHYQRQVLTILNQLRPGGPAI